MNKTGWIVATAIGVVALLFGFCVGWFGNQIYIRSQFEAAFEDIGTDLEEYTEDADTDMEAMEEYEEEPEEVSGAPGAPPEGEPTDGVFDYEVTDARTSDTYNDESCGQHYSASGVYHVLTISAENVGSAPAYPPSDSWSGVYAYAEDGTQHSMQSEICSFSDETNPGNSTEYELVFDVPESADLTVLSLAAETAPDMAVMDIP